MIKLYECDICYFKKPMDEISTVKVYGIDADVCRDCREEYMLIPKGGNDKIMTPKLLAKYIIDHFKPYGKILEPASGTGSFSSQMNCMWCEIDKGKDFFDWNKKVDWIITNPPFSKARKFLKHSMEVSDNIVFLITINHILGLKARMKDVHDARFYIREILLIDTPKEFPQSGFQWGVVYFNKLKGDIKISKLIKGE